MGELTEPWNTAAEKAGVRQTFRGIGDAAGVSHVTVRRLISEGRTSPATVEKVARALRVDPATVYEWAGVQLSEWGPWTPPMEAHRLSPRARAALDELIRAVTQEGAGSAEPVVPLRAVPGWAVEEAARTGDRAIDREPPGDEDQSQDPEDWQQ